jgi:hypothetical protein
MGAVILAMLGVFVGCWEWIAERPTSRLMRIPLALLFGCTLAVIIIGVRIEAESIGLDPALFWEALRRFFLSVCIATAICIFLFRFENLSQGRFHRAALSVLVFGLAAIACWQWDQRTPWNKFVYTSEPPTDLTNLLPGKEPIYWEGDVATPWFFLKRASYFSCDQGTGALFSRGTAIAYDARFRNFQKLQTLDFRQYSFCPLTDARRTSPLRSAELSQLCTKEAGLGALILTELVAGAPHRVWIPPVPFKTQEQSKDGARKPFSADRFYIYKCADLR